MAPRHEVGLALALPGRLGIVLARAAKHVQTALLGGSRSDRTFAKLGGLTGNTHLLATPKHRETTIGRNSNMPAEHSLGPAPGRLPTDHAIAWRQGERLAVAQSQASFVQSEHPTTSARMVLPRADGVLTASSARPKIMPVNRSDRRRAAGSQPAQPVVVRTSAASGVTAADSRQSARLSPLTVPALNGKAKPIAVQGDVAATAVAPNVEAARLKVTIGQRRPGAVNAQSTTQPARSGEGYSAFASLPVAQRFGPNQTFRSAAPTTPSIASSAFAPVGRTGCPSAANNSAAVLRIPPPATVFGTPRGQRENELPVTAAAPDGTVAANGNETVGPNGGGPTQGDVFLDGTLVGRWMARKLAREVGRPPSGSPAFDPTRSPFPPGRMIGG